MFLRVSANRPSESMDGIWPSPPELHQIQQYRGKEDTGTWEFKFEIRSDLRGHMEAAMASEAIIMAVPGNMHIGARVIEVALITS